MDKIDYVSDWLSKCNTYEKIEDPELHLGKTGFYRDILLCDNVMMADDDDTDTNIERFLVEQARLFFKLCNSDNKEYVTREDISILAQELTLSHDQIMDTFSSLDTKERGYLTLCEFIDGFGSFLGFNPDDNNRITLNRRRYNEAELLFNLCDHDKKGYVTRQDLKSSIHKLGLPEYQTSDIPHQLDTDKNGLVSFDEFIANFMKLSVGKEKSINNETTNGEDDETFKETDLDRPNKAIIGNGFHDTYIADRIPSATDYRTTDYSKQISVRYENTSEFREMIELLGEEVDNSHFTSQLQTIREVICNNSNDGDAAQIFETFLSKINFELKSAKEETKHLEKILERKAFIHNAEIKKIYDDMEIQFQNENVNITDEGKSKEILDYGNVQSDLAEKSHELDRYIQIQTTLEHRLEIIEQQAQQLRNDNSMLQKENVLLANKLNISNDNMETMKSNFHRLEEKTSLEKKETLKAAVQATQGLQSDHEYLLRELHALRTTNEKLKDDRDALESTLYSTVAQTPSWADEMDVQKVPIVQRSDSTMNKYNPLQNKGCSNKSNIEYSSSESNQTFSIDGPNFQRRTKSKAFSKQGSVMSTYFGTLTDHVHPSIDIDLIDRPDGNPSDYFKAISVDETPSLLRTTGELDTIDMDPLLQGPNMSSRSGSTSSLSNDSSSLTRTATHDKEPSTQRHLPVGTSIDEHASDINTDVTSEHPTRLYKVVLVGDSCVGKSSFIHRFCFGEFKATSFGATIGVDFQVKTIKIEHEAVALQLWDTAGQERFRSITKNYFRRADGVIIMFDLTSESTFLNVKSWMNDVSACADADVTVMMIANKLDLVKENEDARVVPYKTACELAHDYNALYCEVSARMGTGIDACLEKLSEQMLFNEDSHIKCSGLNLDDAVVNKKKTCCNR